MNSLVLIGNGFDLAHGLKTSYSDFILWYLNDICLKARQNNGYSDKLIQIPFVSFNPFESLHEFKNTVKELEIKINYKNRFFQDIVDAAVELNWVDIESLYYLNLVKIYKNFAEFGNSSAQYAVKEVKELNYSLDLVKNKLTEYLTLIEQKLDSSIKNSEIEKHFSKIIHNEMVGINKQTLFLNFNYTATVDLYLNPLLRRNTKTINIHGKLNDIQNPIIFGYGDEMDAYYEKIESLDENDFLMNIKSFSYFKTKNYQEFSNFIESGTFNVHIIGHSCGLSDRILLNSIFEHRSCSSIKIYYYQKNKNENDFYEKTQQISRHFKPATKGRMRNIIVPFTETNPLINFEN